MTIDPTVVVAAITAITSLLIGAARIIYNDLKRDRDMWKEMALRGTALAELAEGKKRRD